MELSGNRFGRGLVVPGGVRFGLDRARCKEMLARLARASSDLKRTADIMLGTGSVLSRFEHTGTVSREHSDSLGMVGPAARACGSDRDVRRDHAAGVYCFAHVPVALSDSGDVEARAYVRWLETQRSLVFVREQLTMLREGELQVPMTPLRPQALAVSLVEGWRGEIAHFAATDDRGQLAFYHPVDPSFHNWFGLAMALRGADISDFPLCNKSFNLSYAGHDL
jgi:Ni,Fe-hydrogenase III large subunit